MISLQHKFVTSAEREVLDLVVQGLSNSEIAERLGLTREGVRSRLKVAYQKLGIPGHDEQGRRVQAAMVWMCENCLNRENQ